MSDRPSPPDGGLSQWTEIRTAYYVGRFGSVSSAAGFLGIHRATVVRHIDTLEEALGAKLFQRNAKGYVLTEIGDRLMDLAEGTEAQLQRLMGEARDPTPRGELIVTSLPAATPFVVPHLSRFLRSTPSMSIRYVSSPEILRLEFGEAHCAFRVGQKPTDPDQVVQRFSAIRLGMYASPEYIAEHGRPSGPDDLTGHRFLDLDRARQNIACLSYLRRHATQSQIIFRGTSTVGLDQALVHGAGIGFYPVELKDAWHPELVEIVAPDPAWQVPIWLVSHVDLHRSAKVQALIAFLRAEGFLGAASPAGDPG